MDGQLSHMEKNIGEQKLEMEYQKKVMLIQFGSGLLQLHLPVWITIIMIILKI